MLLFTTNLKIAHSSTGKSIFFNGILNNIVLLFQGEEGS